MNRSSCLRWTGGAYHWLHHSAPTVVQATVVLHEIDFIALHLTFGGAPNPSRWSDLSESSCDLANTLVRHPGWHSKLLFSPHQNLLGKVLPEILPADIPFAPAAPVDSPEHVDDAPLAEVFIDDSFINFLLRDQAHGFAILAFAVHLLSWQVAETEALFWDDNLSLKKFLAETTPAEIKLIMGWFQHCL